MMTIHIALLRGINVGGNKMIAMADLRELLTKLGFAHVRSLLQSGNLVFRSNRHTPAELEALLEAETEKRLGVQSDVFVRTAAEWEEVVAGNPFAEEAKRDPGHLIVMFLRKAGDVKAVQGAIVGRETVRGSGRQLYIVYPDGMGKSKLTNTVIEKKLGTRGTARNWNTVMKLARLAGEE